MDAQIDAVGRDTDVVLLTIGGNDVHFSEIIKQCFVIGVRDPGDCRDNIEAAQAGIGDVGVRTASFLRTLKARMRPDAHIVLAAYPHLEKDPGFELRGGFLFLDVYPVGREIRELGDLGDDSQRRAADAVNAEGGAHVTLVDEVKPHFAGHEPDGRVCCRNDDRWIHEFDTTTPMEWYHYNSTGHEELASLLAQRPEIVPDTRDVVGGGAVDIAFVIDTTGSMYSSIESVKSAAVQLVNDVSARTSAARFALVDYRDFPDRTGDPGDYPAKLDQDFTSSATTINTAIQGLSLGDGGDWPETMFSGINRAFDLSWRPGVKKLAIVLADAPPLSPEPHTGLTADDIVQRSLSIDPVETHFVDVGDAADAQVLDIAGRTNGGVHPSAPSQAAAEIAQIIDGSLDRPYAWAGGPYVGKIGSTFTLDGSGSYGVTSELMKWEWDFDSDGTYDAVRDQPTVQHTFASAYDGVVTLRVTDAEGRTGLATAIAHITVDGDEIDTAEDNCPAVENVDQSDYDGDGAGDACDPTPGYPTQDQEGVRDNGSASAGQQTISFPEIATSARRRRLRPRHASSGLPVSYRPRRRASARRRGQGPDPRIGTAPSRRPGRQRHLRRRPAPQRAFAVTYAFSGFFPPVDMGANVLNKASAGRTIPVKFRLGGNQGLGVLAAGSPTSGTIACDADAVVDAVEELSAATTSSLTYDAVADQYHYNWKTEKSFAGSCRHLVVKLADGTSHRANFAFTK